MLGSINLVKYIVPNMKVDPVTDEGIGPEYQEGWEFDYAQLEKDIPHIVRAVDNVIDRTEYPLIEQEVEAKSKRRMGMGITGLANALTLLGIEYGTNHAIKWTKAIMQRLMVLTYMASNSLAHEKGSFPAYDPLHYNSGEFIKRLPKWLRYRISLNGIRNSHLLSIAPTGTISFTADNISSGMEPVFAHEVNRIVNKEFGPESVRLKDHVWHYYGLKGKTSDQLTVDEHLSMQMAVQPYVDSAVSKTINVGDDVTFSEFKDVYIKAWQGGLKGITTFRLSGKRYGIITKADEDGAACYINTDTGNKECS